MNRLFGMLFLLGVFLMVPNMAQAMELVDVTTIKSINKTATEYVNIDGETLSVSVDYSNRKMPVVTVKDPRGKIIVQQGSKFIESISLKRISYTNPQKSFLAIRSYTGAYGYCFNIWIIGKYKTGAYTAFFTPESFKQLSIYGDMIMFANESGVLALNGMNERQTSNGQRIKSYTGQYVMPWDEEAYWFGIGKVGDPEYCGKIY